MQATITNEQIMTNIEINISDIDSKYPLIGKAISQFISSNESAEKIVDRDFETYDDYIFDVKLKPSKDFSGFTLYSKITAKIKDGEIYAKNIDFIHIKARKVDGDDTKIKLNSFIVYLTAEEVDGRTISGKYDLIENWESFQSQSIENDKKLFIPLG